MQRVLTGRNHLVPVLQQQSVGVHQLLQRDADARIGFLQCLRVLAPRELLLWLADRDAQTKESLQLLATRDYEGF